MKKLIFIALFSTAFIFFSISDAQAQITNIGVNNGTTGKEGGTTRDIEIKDLLLSSGTSGRPRSAMPSVTAILYEEQIEINFNCDLGAVSIAIVDQFGQAVHTASCDTALEPVIGLPAPLTEGLFKIIIYGSVYRGEGNFNL